MSVFCNLFVFFFSSRRRHTRCALVTGVQTCALPIYDMVSRSVPYYDEMQRMTVELVRDFAVDDTNIYDIGCATGTTMALIDRYIGETKVNLVGIDNSQEMLDQAREKLNLLGLHHPFELQCADIHEDLAIENASVVAMLRSEEHTSELQTLMRLSYAVF